MNIRAEKSADIDGIWGINAQAFETEEEANLVNALRDSGLSYISLVAEKGNELVGHILFTPVELVGDDTGLKLMGLAPMSVMPELQNKGIGSLLVKAGIEECASKGFDAIFVLGHPEYYPKFGFVPSVRYDIKSQYDGVPDEAFMVLELVKDCLQGKCGIVKYHEMFGGT